MIDYKVTTEWGPGIGSNSSKVLMEYVVLPMVPLKVEDWTSE